MLAFDVQKPIFSGINLLSGDPLDELLRTIVEEEMQKRQSETVCKPMHNNARKMFVNKCKTISLTIAATVANLIITSLIISMTKVTYNKTLSLSSLQNKQ